MRAVIQRVHEASVTVDGRVIGKIAKGLLVLLGVAEDDSDADARYLAEKITGMRCFSDDASKFNLSIVDVGGSILAVSQFTLYGDCRKGKRPSFSDAARPELALSLYEAFVRDTRSLGIAVETGEFGAHMDVQLVNDGPVTLLLDSKRAF
ncbi:MAG TPA: D-aminoacyl-tRNA deacylase [Candidatus Hydrogenedentes bacterium]|nr:D-aminoacyl-tRNA deacylase [Candidatus Hydrogenedentota bacterium]